MTGQRPGDVRRTARSCPGRLARSPVKTFLFISEKGKRWSGSDEAYDLVTFLLYTVWSKAYPFIVT